MLYALRVELQKPEIVDRVTVDGVRISLFVGVKDAVSAERTSSHHVAVRQDVAVRRAGQPRDLVEELAPTYTLWASTTNPVAWLQSELALSKEHGREIRMVCLVFFLFWLVVFFLVASC